MQRIFDVMIDRYIVIGLEDPPMTLGYAPEELTAYDKYIEDVRVKATRHGHLDQLRLGLQIILGTRGFDLVQFCQSNFTWRPEQLREALAYMYQRLYPNEPIPEGGPKDAVLVPCTWPTWNLTMPGSPDELRPPKAR